MGATTWRKKVGESSLVTDRHYQIAKWVRENLPDTDHRYDIWHMAKGIEAFCYTERCRCIIMLFIAF